MNGFTLNDRSGSIENPVAARASTPRRWIAHPRHPEPPRPYHLDLIQDPRDDDRPRTLNLE